MFRGAGLICCVTQKCLLVCSWLLSLPFTLPHPTSISGGPLLSAPLLVWRKRPWLLCHLLPLLCWLLFKTSAPLWPWLLLCLRSLSPGPAEQGSHELSVKPKTGGHLASCYCSGPVLSMPSSYPPASCAPPASSNQPLSPSAWGRLDLISESPCPPPSD